LDLEPRHWRRKNNSQRTIFIYPQSTSPVISESQHFSLNLGFGINSPRRNTSFYSKQTASSALIPNKALKISSNMTL
jgi:hypothetical protein